MTEKRLNIDLIEDLFVREELIRLYDENEQLKQFKEQNIQDYLKLKKVCNNTKKENENIRNTIKEAYHNERTHIGQSVLKQLLEAIQ